MSTALAKGQNAPLTALRLRVTVNVADPVDLSALLVTAAGRVRHDADFIFYNQPQGPGVSCHGAADGRPQRIEVDLAAVPVDVERVLAVVSLDSDGRTFGELPAPTARLTGTDGEDLGRFVMDDLRDERAVIAFEMYRRNDTWKVRAIGQGYAGGLAELATVHGVDVEQPQPEPVSTPSQPGGAGSQPARTLTAPSGGSLPPPVGPSDEERLYDQVWSIFEDAGRSTAAFRSASEHAARRYDSELSQLLADPRTRNSPETDASRTAIRGRHDDLMARANADHRRDIDQLLAELRQLDPVLPPAMASWASPAWAGWRPPGGPAMAIRVGELNLPDCPEMRVPFVFRLPLHKPLWIDSADGNRPGACETARTLIARMLAAHPHGSLTVHIADLYGQGAAANGLEGLGRPPGLGLIKLPLATTPQDLAQLLTDMVERVDLVQMAIRADAVDTLAGRMDLGQQLVVLYDFPYGFDDRALAHLRFLVDEGPGSGVHLLLVADPSEAATLGPLASSLWRSMTRLSATPQEYICDPWVGLSWTFTPDTDPRTRSVVDTVLARLSRESGS